MSRDREATFIELCLAGRAQPEDIDDFVDAWHEGDSALELHEALGLTWDEYAQWVAQPDILPSILETHREAPARGKRKPTARSAP